ncbi:MAG TPA: hypothetical protein VGS97_23180 [Actinocrinis sp.]|uniref:hypothetical protein n=1 Tax=Actinocrinis sp. TaxID=1920516 RepID=UPI002DDD5771|nr:hypothetical protein [Actinocrinis sp.]HEV2347024.1 hypothetical protein [Actinocrinis sp.]
MPHLTEPAPTPTPTPTPTPVDLVHHTLIDAAMTGRTLVHRIDATQIGAELRDALLNHAARDYLLTYCARESGARRVLALTLALGHGARTAEHAVAAYTAAAFAALALGQRERGILLLDAALEAEDALGHDYVLAHQLALGIYLCDLPAAAYREMARSTRRRLRLA